MKTTTVPVEAMPSMSAIQRASLDRVMKPYLNPTPEEDPLRSMLQVTSGDARQAGLTDADIDTELAAYNAERRT